MNGQMLNMAASDPDVNERALDIWLEHAVVPAYDAYKVDPARAQPLSDAMNRIRERIRNQTTDA